MIGKRVKLRFFSVFGPDVFLDTNDIGILQSFDKYLTIPGPVTSMNVKEMRKVVLNGADKYPGATEVEDINPKVEIRVTKRRPADN